MKTHRLGSSPKAHFKVGAVFDDGRKMYYGVRLFDRYDPWKELPSENDVVSSFALREDQKGYGDVFDYETLINALDSIDRNRLPFK